MYPAENLIADADAAIRSGDADRIWEVTGDMHCGITWRHYTPGRRARREEKILTTKIEEMRDALDAVLHPAGGAAA